MNLQDIAIRTHLPLRTLRYVIDHKIVPNLRVRVEPNEVGRPRFFADDFGVGIACAAHLLEAGLRRDAVQECIQIMGALNDKPERLKDGVTVATVIDKRLDATVEFGDGKAGRLIVEAHGIDSGWLSTRPLARLTAEYSPTVIVRLNVGAILRSLFPN